MKFINEDARRFMNHFLGYSVEVGANIDLKCVNTFFTFFSFFLEQCSETFLMENQLS